MMTEVPAAAVVKPVINTPVVEKVAGAVKAPTRVAGPQPEVVETTHPKVVAVTATEQSQMIAESGVTVVQEVVEHAEPVVEPQEETADIGEVAETARVMVTESEVVARPTASVVAKVTIGVGTVAAAEPEVTVEYNHATAPTMRAPAPEYIPEAPHRSDWQRPIFTFKGGDVTGDYTTTYHVSAAPARPQLVG